MNLSYITNSKDHIVLLNRVLSQSVLGKNFSKYTWIAISLLAWMSVILPYLKFQDFGIGFWLRTIFALMITIAWPYFYNKYTDGVFSNIINDTTLIRYAGQTNLKLSEDFIEVLTQTTTSKANWKDIHSVEINDTHIFIFFTPLIASPIPLTAFKDMTEQQAFMKNIEYHIAIVYKI